jgi:hypothetical protein
LHSKILKWPEPPVSLEGDVELDHLEEDEIQVALSSSNSPRVGFDFGSRPVGPAFGVRTFFETPLFSTAVPPDQVQVDQENAERAWERARLVLVALRLFTTSRIGSVGEFQYSFSHVGVRSVRGEVSEWFSHPSVAPYVLTSEQARSFRDFWTAFLDVHKRRSIEGALRRFSYAFGRTLPDDRIVDLMIAAEALLFSDMGVQDRGEFRFRLATRMALLIGNTPEERRQIARFARHAYDVRSGIVHGGVPDAADLRGLDGGSASTEEFAAELEHLLRRMLRRAVASAFAHTEPFPPDWDELMFNAAIGGQEN